MIASGAILGVGASFLWVSQGAIMTTYVSESQKGRSIALFWIIFNLGGMIGSLTSFGLNYNSSSGTVTDSTYIAIMVIMIFGWIIGLFICPPSQINLAELNETREGNDSLEPHEDTKKNAEINDKRYESENRRLGQSQNRPSIKESFKTVLKVLLHWKIISMFPIFFCANVFYSYQQNDVNGSTFTIRTRSLNSALYWMAQMFGGLLMGEILDLKPLNRRQRAWFGWIILMVTGMAIWGGGYAFQRWHDKVGKRNLNSSGGVVGGVAGGVGADTGVNSGATSLDVDYTDSHTATGPMFLYLFYGMYDALWQTFTYWLIGTISNDPSVAAVLVGAYKTLQATGGAMAWRINALGKSGMLQLAMDWGLCIGALVLVIPTVVGVTLTSCEGDGDRCAIAGDEQAEQKDGRK